MRTSGHTPPAGGPDGRPRRDHVCGLTWERLKVPPDELDEEAGEREVWDTLLRLLLQ